MRPGIQEMSETMMSQKDESSGIVMAKEIIDTYRLLDPKSKLGFFIELAERFSPCSFAKKFLCHTKLLTPLAFPQIQGKHVSQIHRHPCHYILLLLKPGFRLNISVLPRPANC